MPNIKNTHSRGIPVIVRTHTLSHTNDTVSPSQLVLIARQLDSALLLRISFIYNSSQLIAIISQAARGSAALL